MGIFYKVFVTANRVLSLFKRTTEANVIKKETEKVQ